jgi:Ni,Fe-hydrogenase III large subunit/Ni,Fe-hydrogenase III component G
MTRHDSARPRRVDRSGWLAAAQAALDAGGRLVALWGADRRPQEGLAACAAYLVKGELVWADLDLGADETYPGLSRFFPHAVRMERAAYDLVGVQAEGGADGRPWLDHDAWSRRFPLRTDAVAAAGAALDYPFVRVEGEGVHEIAVGPVHAGIIEPGHFRFSVVGEKVLRLEQRLGYTHKGIEKRFTELEPLEAHRLAGRVSGDCTVAYAWAYCTALEAAAGVHTPPRAAWLRALALERERVANHLGDLGALGNDAALAVGLAHFSRLRELWQRRSRELFGHRFMMDYAVPGGVGGDLDAAQLAAVALDCAALEREVRELRTLYDEHAGLQDRFVTTGRVTPALAQQLGLTGLAARASGQAIDLRVERAGAPYAELGVRLARQKNGDVAARVNVRFDEVLESLRLIREICARAPGGPVRATCAVPAAGAGIGAVEGWRGEVLVALELAGGRLRRCHAHDPSWQNWPALEHAVIGNIVPDFPLINKSFNLSYSGHDL